MRAWSTRGCDELLAGFGVGTAGLGAVQPQASPIGAFGQALGPVGAVSTVALAQQQQVDRGAHDTIVAHAEASRAIHDATPHASKASNTGRMWRDCASIGLHLDRERVAMYKHTLAAIAVKSICDPQNLIGILHDYEKT